MGSYGIFREASTKNKDASFGIVKDKALAAKCGVTRMPLVLTVHYDEDGKQYEMRRTQFFDDMTIYYSDDKTRRLASSRGARRRRTISSSVSPRSDQARRPWLSLQSDHRDKKTPPPQKKKKKKKKKK